MLSLSITPPLTMVETRTTISFFTKVIIHLSCAIFVAFQAQKCIDKYIHEPKVTHVSIKDAGSQPYPEVTFCRRKDNQDYVNTSKECNLTVEDYFDWNTWVGLGNGSEVCKDPKKLYERGKVCDMEHKSILK